MLLKKILMKKKNPEKSLNNSTEDLTETEINMLSSYFGYSTFFKDPEIFQKSSDFSIPPSYIIGPGDEIILMLWEIPKMYLIM